jgi:hypothetical protein
MKKTSTVLRIALLVAGFMAVVGPALAQDKPADNMQILLDKIKADKKLLDDLVTLKMDHAKLMASSVPQFRKILPDTKVARYFQIENKVDAILSYELAKVIPLVK